MRQESVTSALVLGSTAPDPRPLKSSVTFFQRHKKQAAKIPMLTLPNMEVCIVTGYYNLKYHFSISPPKKRVHRRMLCCNRYLLFAFHNGLSWFIVSKTNFYSRPYHAFKAPLWRQTYCRHPTDFFLLFFPFSFPSRVNGTHTRHTHITSKRCCNPCVTVLN